MYYIIFDLNESFLEETLHIDSIECYKVIKNFLCKNNNFSYINRYTYSISNIVSGTLYIQKLFNSFEWLSSSIIKLDILRVDECINQVNEFIK